MSKVLTPQSNEWTEITIQEHKELKESALELHKLKKLIKIIGLEEFLNTADYLLQYEIKLNEFEIKNS